MASKYESYRECCPFHPNANLIEYYGAGDIFCVECGQVVRDRVIDLSLKLNKSSNSILNCWGDRRNPFLMDDTNLTTKISAGFGAASGRRKYKKRQTTSKSDCPFIDGNEMIFVMANRINLPKAIIERAMALMKQVKNSKSLSKRSTNCKASACLYIACRQEGEPRTFKEICDISQTNKSDLVRCFKICLKVLDTSVAVITTDDFMGRFCCDLELPMEVERAAAHIAKKAIEIQAAPGRSPISVVAAAIYMASQASQASEDRRSTKEICNIAGVVEVTIRSVYKDLLQFAIKLIPENFKLAKPIEKLPPC